MTALFGSGGRHRSPREGGWRWRRTQRRRLQQHGEAPAGRAVATCVGKFGGWPALACSDARRKKLREKRSLPVRPGWGEELAVMELFAAGKEEEMATWWGSGDIDVEALEALAPAAPRGATTSGDGTRRGVEQGEREAHRWVRPLLQCRFCSCQIFFKLLCIDSIQRLCSCAPKFPNKICTCR
jgi:hypothetical protein